MRVLLAVLLTCALIGCKGEGTEAARPSETPSASTSANPVQAVSSATQALQPNLQQEKQDMMGGMQMTTYLLNGMPFEDALAKIEPGLVSAGFAKQSNLDQASEGLRSVNFVHEASGAMAGVQQTRDEIRYSTFLKP